MKAQIESLTKALYDVVKELKKDKEDKIVSILTDIKTQLKKIAEKP